MTSNRGILLSVAAVVCLAAPVAGAWDTNDWQFLETIEKTNLRFFLNEKHGHYDLLTDNAA